MKRRKILLTCLIICICFLTANLMSQVLEPRIEVSIAPGFQGFTQVAYNGNADEYLIVWEDARNAEQTGTDIWGQIVRGDGTLRGENFPVCVASAEQYWPHIAFDPLNNQYLVVFEDYRNGTGNNWTGNFDIYAALLDINGNHIWTTNSEADTCFGICKDTSAVHYPDVSFNYINEVYLVVWQDYRNSTIDVYGQRISVDGDLLPPPDIPGAGKNFFISDEESLNQEVPVVSYCSRSNEWFVVFGSGQTGTCAILGQRVNQFGELLKIDGTPGEETILITDETGFCADPSQPRVQFNNEWMNSRSQVSPLLDFAESLVAWRKFSNSQTDIVGQRVAFFPDSIAVKMGLKATPTADSLFFAALIDTLGHLGEQSTTNFPICDAEGNQNAPDIAFSQLDNEFIVGWGDSRRKEIWPDFYGQRLWVNSDTQMIWLNEDRSSSVASSENIPVDISDYYEGGNLVGAAHNSQTNQFFLVYSFLDTTLHRSNDISGRLIGGTPTIVNNKLKNTLPSSFEMKQNYPNPFNPETTIHFKLPRQGHVSVDIFDITGKRIKTLFNGIRPTGAYIVTWNGKNANEINVASGVYIYQIRFANQIIANKMMLIR